MKPSVKDRKKFDLDLSYGSIKEDEVAEILQNAKIEVKSERGMWTKTGNICIEVESWGKPSGIEATESEYWMHNLCIGDDTFCSILISTDNLKKVLEKNKKKGYVRGGDNNASKMVLLNIKDMLDGDTAKYVLQGE